MAPDEVRPPIPAAIKRQVRQRCGFGCVVCGLPLYEYEHILGWAKVRRHVASEITLLCDRHHREKTVGLLPRDTLSEANAEPHNLRAGVSAPYALHYSGAQSEVVVGSNRVVAGGAGDFAAVMIDSVPLVAFRFEDGHYLLNILLFDEANRLVVKILDNELTFSAEPWDIDFVGTRLIVRARAREIFVDLEFAPPSKVILSRGRILLNGIELFVRPNYVLLVNNQGLFSGGSFFGCSVALNIGEDARNVASGIRWNGVPRYAIDREAALQWALEQTGEWLPEAGESPAPSLGTV